MKRLLFIMAVLGLLAGAAGAETILMREHGSDKVFEVELSPHVTVKSVEEPAEEVLSLTDPDWLIKSTGQYVLNFTDFVEVIVHIEQTADDGMEVCAFIDGDKRCTLVTKKELRVYEGWTTYKDYHLVALAMAFRKEKQRECGGLVPYDVESIENSKGEGR